MKNLNTYGWFIAHLTWKLTASLTIAKPVNGVNLMSKNVGILGHAVAHWLRHCATSRKVTGSIPDGVMLPDGSGQTVALGMIQPLTEMSTRNISCGVKVAGA